MKRPEAQRGGGSPSARRSVTESNGKGVRVLVVDDHALIRAGVVAVLSDEPGVKACYEAADGPEAMKWLRKARPHVALVDLFLHRGNGFDLIGDIRLHFPDVAVLVLTMHEEHLFAERALRAGARGYVMKQDPPQRLLTGIFAVLAGEYFVSRELADMLLGVLVDGRTRKQRHGGVERLSDRELLVFQGVGHGQSTHQIAEQLNLSPKTVETYRANIKRKLGLERSASLIHAAISHVQGNLDGSYPGVEAAPRGSVVEGRRDG